MHYYVRRSLRQLAQEALPRCGHICLSCHVRVAFGHERRSSYSWHVVVIMLGQLAGNCGVVHVRTSGLQMPRPHVEGLHRGSFDV